MAIVYDDNPAPTVKKSRVTYDKPTFEQGSLPPMPGEAPTADSQPLAEAQGDGILDQIKRVVGSVAGPALAGLGAVGEVGLSGLTSLAGTGANLANAVTGATPYLKNQGESDADFYRRTREESTYQPRIEAGQQLAQNPVFQKIGEFVEQGGEGFKQMTGSDAGGELFKDTFGAATVRAPFAKGKSKGAAAPLSAADTALAESTRPTTSSPAQVMRSSGVKILPSQVDPTTGKTAGGLGSRIVEKVAGGKAPDVLRVENLKLNKKAARAIGAADDAPMDATTFKKLKEPENAAYGALANRIGKMAPDPKFQADVAGITKDTLVRDAGIDNLVQTFSGLGETTAQTVLTTIRDLRKQGYLELNKSYPQSNPALGKTRLKIADQLDDLLARTASEYGVDPKITNSYLAARQKLAKIATVENATNAGIVSPAELANLKSHGIPLSGELDKLAFAGEHAPDVVGKKPQNAVAPPTPDIITQAANVVVAPVRAGAQKLLTSDWLQNKMGREGATLGSDVPLRPDAPPPQGGIPVPDAPVRPPAPPLPRPPKARAGIDGPQELSIAEDFSSGGVPSSATPRVANPKAYQMADDLTLLEDAPRGGPNRFRQDYEPIATDAVSEDGPFAYGRGVPYREPAVTQPTVSTSPERLTSGQAAPRDLTIADDFTGGAPFNPDDFLAGGRPPGGFVGPLEPNPPPGPFARKGPPDDGTTVTPNEGLGFDMARDLGIEVVESREPGFFEVRINGEKSATAVQGRANAESLARDIAEELMGEPPPRGPQTSAPPPVVPSGRYGGQGMGEDLAPQTYRVNNDSGSGPASLEAQSRVRQEKAAGQNRYVINPDDTVTPLVGVDAVDAAARKGQVIVQRGVGNTPYTVLDRGGLSKRAAENRINMVADLLGREE